MDLEVLNLAVPALTADLQPSSAQLLWIIDIYGFMVAGSLITMGTLGDRIGRRRLLLVGAAAFGAASVLAAFSTSAGMLIATRALLGLAGATLAPSTLSLIRNMFTDPGQRRVAVAVWAASFSAGAAIGPLAGGLLLERFWWGSVFLLAVPVMALLLVLGPLLLPEYRDPDAGRLDLPSAAMSLASVLAAIYGLKLLALDGLGWEPVLALVAGLAVGDMFVRRQRALADPLVDLALFANRVFSASLAVLTLSLFVTFGIFLFVAQYLQLVLGLSPLQAGLWTLPSALGLVAGSMLTPLLARRARPAVVMAAGLGLAAVGFGLLTLVGGTAGLGIVVAGSAVLSLGVAPVGTLATDLIVGSAPPERAGSAAGLSETGAELGGALGIAVLGSVGAAAYRAQMADTIPPGVPPAAADAARDTLGAALVAAGQLPAELGTALLDAARQAFTEGFQLTAAISAALALALAALAAALLGRAHPRHPTRGAGQPGIGVGSRHHHPGIEEACVELVARLGALAVRAAARAWGAALGSPGAVVGADRQARRVRRRPDRAPRSHRPGSPAAVGRPGDGAHPEGNTAGQARPGGASPGHLPQRSLRPPLRRPQPGVGDGLVSGAAGGRARPWRRSHG
jgi:MFS transporter, DHA2 family, multidrug resistance protein